MNVISSELFSSHFIPSDLFPLITFSLIPYPSLFEIFVSCRNKVTVLPDYQGRKKPRFDILKIPPILIFRSFEGTCLFLTTRINEGKIWKRKGEGTRGALITPSFFFLSPWKKGTKWLNFSITARKCDPPMSLPYIIFFLRKLWEGWDRFVW